MSEGFTTEAAAFDRYAAEYDEALAQGLAVSGEDKTYFARERVAWLKGVLARLNHSPAAVLDFGCGTGSSTPFLLAIGRVTTLVGVDVSARSLEQARREHGATGARFLQIADHQAQGTIDLAFCNGVFHHIPPADRGAAVRHVHRSLRPGGLFAFWENNPWNPGSRYVMSRIPFDRDAIMLTPREARALLRENGFEIVRTDFLFIFPRMLRWLRAIEPRVSSLPLGAQYQVLARRPN
ncbi:MAG TPA: methyltransferase [Gemmatimonadales bacterium]|nr:methyltransferase [Gemmatimonadales bacterium]